MRSVFIFATLVAFPTLVACGGSAPPAESPGAAPAGAEAPAPAEEPAPGAGRPGGLAGQDAHHGQEHADDHPVLDRWRGRLLRVQDADSGQPDAGSGARQMVVTTPSWAAVAVRLIRTL